MEHAVDYIIKEHKAFSLETMKKHLNSTLDHLNSVNTSFGERATYINCSSLNTYKDFENLRRAFDQDKGVIAHHYYQSFQKDDNVTPEQAHQIGVELAKKMFPNFQVVVATH
ncbi:Relaxase/Mobilisation nuclease domain-containing protein, partial [Ruminococcus sp. XPD3002]